MEFGYPTDLTKFMSGRESRVEKNAQDQEDKNIQQQSEDSFKRPLQMTEKK